MTSPGRSSLTWARQVAVEWSSLTVDLVAGLQIRKFHATSRGRVARRSFLLLSRVLNERVAARHPGLIRQI
jgi:hypothetical protein